MISLAILGLGLSGAASMIYEVAWSQALALIIGSSTYAFTAMLVAFLVGIALGSALFSRLWRTGSIHPFSCGVLQCAIGLGSGVTAAAVARHPVERIEVIEIEPAVVRAARFFAKKNRNVFNDPRVQMIIADGRNFLLSTSARYDVIISEPSNPWIRGIATLFSQEFFTLAKRKLQPGGVMLQWVHGYGLAPRDLQMVVKTFRTTFPATTVWQASVGDYTVSGQ